MILYDGDNLSYNYTQFLLERLQVNYKVLLNDIRRLSFLQYENITGFQKIHNNISDSKYSLIFDFDELKYDLSHSIKDTHNVIRICDISMHTSLEDIAKHIDDLSVDYFNDIMSFEENDNLINGLINNKYSIYLMSMEDLKVLLSDNILLKYCGRHFKSIYVKIFKLLWHYASMNDMYDDKFLLEQYHKLALINYYTNGVLADVPTGLNYEYLKKAYNFVLTLTVRNDSDKQLAKAIHSIISNDNIMYEAEDNKDKYAYNFFTDVMYEGCIISKRMSKQLKYNL